jgi:hypothetical protein
MNPSAAELLHGITYLDAIPAPDAIPSRMGRCPQPCRAADAPTRHSRVQGVARPAGQPACAVRLRLGTRAFRALPRRAGLALILCRAVCHNSGEIPDRVNRC